MRGFTFPFWRQRKPRASISFCSRAADVTYGALLSLNGNPQRLRLIQSSPGSVRFYLTGLGVTRASFSKGKVSLTRVKDGG
jgi:hypothetical protein